ncbi:DUF262 domain-containing protein [Archangium violaceum]|uniref:GmrSD restriction endonucleases N-terminal domain-containing protein n=1 Tax=Archangium violaceum Cb vi76 TaxID=1406225 RepID=A0A084SV83_9BACT|nr:DUF262 domain-containing protein [Archangium violaceum]KFA92368.1 hypothetical protein Q664_15930 [Archangium violaceum Cb vi76]
MRPPSPLTRRPRATAFSIKELLDRVRRGSIRIPELQRPFKWKAREIQELLDSVYRGYPIGVLLFWQHEAPAAHLEIGPVKLDAPQTARALWVVDGQHRVTALAGVLLHPSLDGEGGSGDFGLYFDLEREELVRPNRQEPPPPHWLPMNVVADSERLRGWLERYSGLAEHPEHTRTASRLGTLLREYQLPAYIVEAEARETLPVIVERLNIRSKTLPEAKVLQSLLEGRNPEHLSDLRALSLGLEEMRFGTIEEKWLLKSVAATQGLDITRSDWSQLKGVQDVPGALRQTERALRDTIVFLKRDAGIPHVELLPYKLPLVFLARFFHLHPEPSARSRELLARWLWRGAISGAHRGESAPSVRKNLTVLGQDEDEAIQALLTALPTAVPRAPNLRDFKYRAAETRLQLNALLALQPRELRSGELLDVPTIIGTQGAEALRQLLTSVPRLRPDDDSVQLKSLMQGLANRIFHPEISGQSLLAAIEQASPEVLGSHGISPSARKALQQGDRLRFLTLRLKLLEQHVATFLDSKARWLESDRKPLQSLLIPNEDES